MEKHPLEFALTRPAKKLGGDRYEYKAKGDPEWIVIYIPQRISRPTGQPLQKMTVTFG